MPPLGTLDALDDLVRRRMLLAAAARAWPTTITDPVISGAHAVRPHAARTLMELDTLLALGVVPATVGSSSLGPAAAWPIIAREAGIAVVDTAYPHLMARQLREAGADLVVVSDLLARTAPAEIAAYHALALPVVELPAADVAGQLRVAADALGRPDRADRLATDIDQLFTEAAVAMRPGPLAVFTVRAGAPDGWVHVPTPEAPVSVLLRRLGIPVPRLPSSARRVAPDASAVRAVDLLDIAAERLLGLETTEGALAEVEPLLAGHPAARAGRYRRIDPAGTYALAMPSVLTLPTALAVLTAALDDQRPS